MGKPRQATELVLGMGEVTGQLATAGWPPGARWRALRNKALPEVVSWSAIGIPIVLVCLVSMTGIKMTDDLTFLLLVIIMLLIIGLFSLSLRLVKQLVLPLRIEEVMKTRFPEEYIKLRRQIPSIAFNQSLKMAGIYIGDRVLVVRPSMRDVWTTQQTNEYLACVTVHELTHAIIEDPSLKDNLFNIDDSSYAQKALCEGVAQYVAERALLVLALTLGHKR